MVKSGLVSNTDVSHDRLALHLTIALLILSFIFWFILQNLNIQKFKNKLPQNTLRIFLFLIILQIILGAFLAGLNGGLLYNTWPDMNGGVLPNDIITRDLFLFESTNNPSVIQFYHRIIAYLIIFYLETVRLYQILFYLELETVRLYQQISFHINNIQFYQFQQRYFYF